MGAVLCAREVYHAVDAGKGGTATAVSMRVELLLGQDVAAGLFNDAETVVRCCRINNTIGLWEWLRDKVRVFSWQWEGNKESDERLKEGRISLIRGGWGVRERGGVLGV
jgi:hypothetical protein